MAVRGPLCKHPRASQVDSAMPTAFDKLAFETAQMARIGWYFGQKLLAARLAKPEVRRYPAYYRQKFHFQSDGYLSEASAERYDHQVEVLFGGGAAAMRRQALVPLRAALRKHPGGAGGAKLLDLGCGTGAFL